MVKKNSSVTHTSFREFNEVQRSFAKLPKTLFDALITLKSDDSIIIVKKDKGRRTVVMNKKDYIQKVEPKLKDISKFKSSKDSAFSYITKLEDKLSKYLENFSKLK